MFRLKRASFNDTLALLLIPGIPGLWLANKWLPIPAEAIGASILAWGNVVQHYFRKAKNDGAAGPPSNGGGP